MDNEKYIELINKLFKDKQPTKEDIYNWLIENEWVVCDQYEKQCHKEDLLQEIEDRGYEKPADKIIDYMLETYEDRLCDSEEWHYILNGVVDDFEVDLKGDEE